jgi:PAS domain S-box-containing protein
MRLFAAVVAFIVLGAGVFLIYENFSGRATLIESDPVYAVENAQQLLQYLLMALAAVVILFSLLIYVVLSMQKSARRLAYKISSEISFTKEQFRRFYELSPVPYLLTDEKGVIRRPNKASLRFFGEVEEDLRNKNIFEYLTHPEKPEKINRYRERVQRHIPVEQREVQVQKKNGEVRWALLSIENLEEGSEGQTRLVTVVDIHEQKELDRMKTEFLSLASHQLRAPLSNLKWYIDFLLKRRSKELSSEIQGYLQKMYRRNQDMIELVNTLLNLSRIEMGRLQVQKERTDIGGLIESVVEELQPEADDKQLTLDTNLTGELHFETDPRLVRIIIQNLLSNALRYTPIGGSVFVRAEASQTLMRIEVKDTGVGIPPEEQSRIFSKLYRATNAKEVEANGNGIGLYMCKSLAEGLGGTISFTSKLNEGTSFVVELPN